MLGCLTYILLKTEFFSQAAYLHIWFLNPNMLLNIYSRNMENMRW
jgi:hypothetical protein